MQGDSATGGLVYLRARWYNPTDGTFLTRDPFPGFAAVPYSLHPYQYGYSNPVSNTDPSGQCTSFGDDYCHFTWEQLYANYPYYAFRTEREADWEQKGWAPEDAEHLVEAYESFLIAPERYVFPTTQDDEYVYAYAQSFANDFLGEYLVFDDSVYQRRFESLKAIMDQCNGNVSAEFYWKYMAAAGAAFGLGYTGPMYDADQRIGGGGGKGGGSGGGNSTLIYREGGRSPSNLKARPQDDGMLSFRDSLSNPWPLPEGEFPPLRKEYIVVDTTKLPTGSVIYDNTPPGHVSVRDVPVEVLQKAIVGSGKFPK